MNMNKNRPVIIMQMIYIIAISCLLFYVFLRNQLIIKIAVTPFLFCMFFKLCDYICQFFQKDKLSYIFVMLYRISFFIYVFGFLIFVDYYSLTHHLYVYLLLSIPFWIAAFYFAYKGFLGGHHDKY